MPPYMSFPTVQRPVKASSQPSWQPQLQPSKLQVGATKLPQQLLQIRYRRPWRRTLHEACAHNKTLTMLAYAACYVTLSREFIGAAERVSIGLARVKGSEDLGSVDEVPSLLQYKIWGPLAGRVPQARHRWPAFIGHPRHPPWQNHDGSSQPAWPSSQVNIKQRSCICTVYMAA